MGLGTKIKEILSDEPHEKDQVPGTYPDENSRQSQGTGMGPGTGTGEGAGAGAAGVAGVAAAGGGSRSGTDKLHKRDDTRGLTDTYDHAGAPTRSNGGAVGGSTPATRGAPAAGSTAAYDEAALPGGQDRDSGRAPAPFAFGPGSSRGGATGTGTEMGAGHPAGHVPEKAELQSRQAASTSNNSSSRTGPGITGAGAGLATAGGAAGLAQMNRRDKDAQSAGNGGRYGDDPSAGGGGRYDDPSGTRNRGLQNRGVAESGGSAGYYGDYAATANTMPRNTMGPEGAADGGAGHMPAGAAAGGAIPLVAAGRTKGNQDTVGSGQFANAPDSANQSGQSRSGAGLAATGAGVGAGAGAAAGSAGARGSHASSGSGSKRGYYGPGHEGATVVHKCESCGADNDISRYFDKGAVYRME